MSAPVTEPLYPTTGEPVSINARRNRFNMSGVGVDEDPVCTPHEPALKPSVKTRGG